MEIARICLAQPSKRTKQRRSWEEFIKRIWAWFHSTGAVDSTTSDSRRLGLPLARSKERSSVGRTRGVGMAYGKQGAIIGEGQRKASVYELSELEGEKECAQLPRKLA